MLALIIEVFSSGQEHEYEQERENDMIARIWHRWTKPEKAKAYEDMLRDEIFPGIARRNIKRYRGAELFIHEDGNETEFVTLLRFDSMEAVKEFAGMDESKPVIYPKAEALLTRMDERSPHYRIAISR
jgi:antibiotic biosynthesis monooxygenase (ABM) superfamily enzyme